MSRLRFRRRPHSGNAESVTLWDKTYQVKAYRGIPLLHRLTHPPTIRYLSVGWFVASFLAARLPYRYTPEKIVAPPPNTANFRTPKYEEIQPGMGYTIASSTKATTYPMFVLDAVVMIGVIYLTVVSGLYFWIVLTVALVMAALTLEAYLRRLSQVAVVTADDLAIHTGLWIHTKHESVEAQGIGAVSPEIPSPKWFWNMLRVTDVTISLSEGGDPIVLKKIDNGDDVVELIEDLRKSFEKRQKESTEANEKSADGIEQLNEKVDYLCELVARQYDTNTKIVELLTKLVEHFVPEMEVLEADEAEKTEGIDIPGGWH